MKWNKLEEEKLSIKKKNPAVHISFFGTYFSFSTDLAGAVYDKHICSGELTFVSGPPELSLYI